jgi:uncharacterized membrane protein
MPVPSKNRRAFSVVPLIVLHLLIVLPLAYFLNIWADEASTLYTTQHGFWAAFQNAATDEKQAPLYFWLMSLWRSIDRSIFFARLFSIICSVAAISAFAGFARKIFAARTAFLATAFFALHPFLIWTSLEIRVYSLVILLSIVLLRLFFDGFLDQTGASAQRNTRILFVAAIVSLYTNYYLGFLLIGLFAVLLISKKWREAGIYLGIMLVMAVAFAPLLIAFRSQFSANTSGFQEERSLLQGLRFLWHHFLTFTLPAEVFPDVGTSVADVVRVWAVRAAIIVVGFFAIKRRDYISSNTTSLGIISSSIFACLVLAYFAVGGAYVEVRHMSVVFAPLIFFEAALLSDIFATRSDKERHVNRVLAAAAGLLVLLSFSYALVTLYPNMAKRGDWARVGAFIQANESPGQPIIVFTTFEALALPYHYHGVNKILPDERFFEFDQEDAFGTENSLKRQTDFVISEIPADAEMVWLAVGEKCLVTEACRPLENYVRANYTIEIEQEFYLEKVFLLRKKHD